MSSGNAIIQLNDVSFSYADGKKRVLDHVSLDVHRGDFLGITGPAGSGKSTLAAVMSGAIPHHYQGELYGATLVDGHDTCEVSLTDISHIVGSVLQDIDTQMVASVVEDEMLFGLENFGVPHDQIEGRIAETLETVGISRLRDREIATLSGGQKQKVAIAAILALKPRVLVLDEPTAALDPASSELVFETLRQVNEQAGVTVVVIEQKVALLSRYCNRIAVIAEGKLPFVGTPHEVFFHADELRELGVDSPRVTRVHHSLVEKGACAPDLEPCINVAEAKALITGLVAPARHSEERSDEESRVSAATSLGKPEISHIGRFAPSVRNDTESTSARPTPSVRNDTEETPSGSAASTRSDEPVVTFRDVCFAYPGSGDAVSDLELTVYPGEFVGIVGQNGAGKTTMTKLLNGLLKPVTGDVVVAGLNTKTTPVSTIAAHVATLFQNPDRQLCKNTVLDEVAFGLELHGTPTEEAQARAREVIDRFGLPADEAPFSLGRGQRQMVALASVVVMKPQVVLLDEPTSGLDYRECMTVMETVREMAVDHDCAVVVVCHDMEVVSDFCQRIVVMANGRIQGAGETHTTFADSELMHAAYVEAPQAIQLACELARDVSPAYEGLFEVSQVVDTTLGLMGLSANMNEEVPRG